MIYCDGELTMMLHRKHDWFAERLGHLWLWPAHFADSVGGCRASDLPAGNMKRESKETRHTTLPSTLS